MFYNVNPHQTMSELYISIDMSCTSKLHTCLPVNCHGLYVMCEGLPVTQRACLSCTTTAIVIVACHNDVMI